MKRYFLVVILLLSCLLTSLLGTAPAIAYADDFIYTNVLEDLQTDENFNKSNYPVKSDDYSLQVIQVAESTTNELFVYVYQPSANVKASSINISTVIGEVPEYNNYKLNFINSNGVFYKYKVNNLTVKQDEIRRYDVLSIFRPFSNVLDDKPTDDNTINELAFKVAKSWTIQTVKDEITEEEKIIYDCIDFETIKITDKHVGFVRYLTGFAFYNSSCDSHYIAFSTDRQIDKLMEAEVYYTTRDVEARINLTGEHPSYGDYKDNYVRLSYTDSKVVNGVFGHEYTWDRIETIEKLVDEEKLSLKDNPWIEGKNWVLRFAETDYKLVPGVSGVNHSYYTEVSNVSILRLKFESEGITYNLGVIDNKQSGDLNPDNNYGWQMPLWLKIIIVVLCLFVLAMVLVFIKPVWDLICKFFSWFFGLFKRKK